MFLSGYDLNNASCSLDRVNCCEDFLFFYHILDTINYIVALVGFFGNAISIRVFYSTSMMKLPHAPFIIGLNISDIIYLISHTTVTIAVYRFDVFKEGESNLIMTHARRYVETVTGTISLLYIFLFTLQRFLSLVSPLKTYSRVLFNHGSWFAWAMPAIVCLVYLFLWMDGKSTATGRVVCVIFLRALPGLGIISFNFILMFFLKEKKSERNSLIEGAIQQNKNYVRANQMLFLISGALIVLNLPFLITYSYVTSKNYQIPCRLYGESENVNITIELTYAITCLIYDLNFALNFFLYCGSVRKFRKAALNMCLLVLPMCKDARTPPTSSTKVQEPGMQLVRIRKPDSRTMKEEEERKPITEPHQEEVFQEDIISTETPT